MALRAGFTDDLGINILTFQGQHIPDWFPVFRGSQRAFRLTNGGVLLVRDYVRLHFWRDGASRSEEEEFYIPLNGNPNIQDIPNTHVILGLDCFLKLEDFTDSHSSLAPIQLGRQTKEQKENQQRALKAKREQAQENANKRFELQKQRRQQRAGATGRT
ncbi:hypothetical protein AKAW_04699 [Aspergillus luchuensis IFO 4308]|nr:hypothetical protein AKAW_04699 [Aspergillus luchuensis IFO 4308]